MTETLVWSDDVRKVAQPLLWVTHARLADKDVRFAFSDKPLPKKLNCKTYSAVKICDPLVRLASSGTEYQHRAMDVAVIVNRIFWDGLEPYQQVAVIDHALSHLWLDEDDVLSLREHEISEFADVIQRNGIYMESMSYAAQVIYQLGAKAVGQ